jgi:hypothetical protein
MVGNPCVILLTPEDLSPPMAVLAGIIPSACTTVQITTRFAALDIVGKQLLGGLSNQLSA